MSPRPQKASDAEIFMAATRVMSRLGPRELTLAHIANEAGLTASALVQRFGSKRGLLLAMSERWANATDELFAGFDRYVGARYVDAYSLMPRSLRTGLMGPVLDRLPDSLTYKSLTQKLRWVHDLSLQATEAEQYRRLGITIMIGRNDTGPITQPDDAQTVLDFAKANGVGRLGIWSLGRDFGTCARQVEAQPDCSGIAQQDYQFTRQLAAFTGPPST